MTKCCKMITEPLYSKFQSESNMMIMYINTPTCSKATPLYSLTVQLMDIQLQFAGRN